MARIVGGVTTSHIPAIGNAMTNKLESEPYWKRFFDGYEPVKEWLAGLPQANLELAARDVLDVLHKVNGVAYAAKQRAHFLDAIHDNVDQLITNLVLARVAAT